MKTHLRGYGRCKWMGIVAIVFTVLTIGFIIPGAIGVSGVNRYNDTLLYLALIDSLFAILFFVGWFMCQFEVDDVAVPVFEAKLRKVKRPSYASMRSTHSLYSTTSNELLTLNASNSLHIEKNV